MYPHFNNTMQPNSYYHQYFSTLILSIPIKYSHIKNMLVNIDFQTWQLIGWQHSRQPIRGHVRKSLYTNMEFNMDFTK